MVRNVRYTYTAVHKAHNTKTPWAKQKKPRMGDLGFSSVFIMTFLSSLGETISQIVGSENKSGGFKFVANITALGNFTREQF